MICLVKVQTDLNTFNLNIDANSIEDAKRKARHYVNKYGWNVKGMEVSHVSRERFKGRGN